MLKINKKVEYALIALKYMAHSGEKTLFSTREICDEFSIPFDTLSKVMQLLCNVGILKSCQGVKGGYTLQKDLSQISFYELHFLIEGDAFGNYCNGPKAICDQFNHCNILSPLQSLNFRVIEFFKNINLKDLLMEAPSFPVNGNEQKAMTMTMPQMNFSKGVFQV